MSRRETEAAIRAVVEPAAAEEGCDLLDVELLGNAGHRILRITLDREEGVNVDHCAAVSRRIGPLLDVDDLVPGGAYHLEVSSPGLNRPLKSADHFHRYLGRRASIRTRRPVSETSTQKTFKGTLESLADGVVHLTDDDGRRFEIPLDLIEKAHLVHEFD